jgi:hypothetical protein
MPSVKVLFTVRVHIRIAGGGGGGGGGCVDTCGCVVCAVVPVPFPNDRVSSPAATPLVSGFGVLAPAPLPVPSPVPGLWSMVTTVTGLSAVFSAEPVASESNFGAVVGVPSKEFPFWSLAVAVLAGCCSVSEFAASVGTEARNVVSPQETRASAAVTHTNLEITL